MSHNALIRGGVGSGLWNNHVVTGAEFELFDQRQFESINGDQGGTWAPASVITIGGVGLTVSTAFTLGNGSAFNIGTSVTFNGSPTWSGTITLSGSLVNGALSISGGVLAIAAGGHITVGGAASSIDLNSGGTFTAAVGSTTTFNNDPTFASGHIVTFDGTEHVNGTLLVSGSGQVVIDTTNQLLNNGTIDNAAIIRNSGAGHIARRYVEMVVGSNLSTGHATADVVLVPAGQGAGHSITLQDGPLNDTAEIEIFCATTNTVSVTGPSVTTQTLSVSVSTAYRHMKWFWTGNSSPTVPNTWQVVGGHQNP